MRSDNLKKTKIISFLVAILAVVALGIFMGKYMFKLMEASTSSAATTKPVTANNPANQGNIKILYGDQSEKSEKKEDIGKIPEKETTQPAEKKDTAAEPKQPEAAADTQTENNQHTTSSDVVAGSTALSFSPTGPKWFAYASTKGLNVRESPTTKGKLLFKVSKGTRGVVKEKKDGWTLIQWDFNRKKGWSTDEYLIQGPAGIIENIVNGSGDKIESIKKEQLTKASSEKMQELNKTIIGVARPAPTSETVITYTNGKDLPKRGTITPSNGANIRQEPTTQSARLIKLPKGTVVGIKSVKQVEKYQWFEITYSNGSKTGWTREDNLKF